MEKHRILVVDDEEIIRQLLVRAFGENDYHVETAKDAEAALKNIKEDSFNLLIMDLRMPKIDGMDALKEIKNVNPYIEVIIITGYPTIESAVEAVKIGAFDFLSKPFDLEQMKTTVSRCLEKQKFALSYAKLGELAKFFEISKTININTDIESLLAKILDSALEIVKAKKGSILLLDENTGELTVRAARGLGEEVINNTNSSLSIPLVSKYLDSQENTLGVINVADKISQEDFTEREKALLSVLAGQATVAIENANIYDQLQGKISALRQTIEQLNQTQNQLIQSEKMAAVGKLTSAIAHEVNNPLMIISGTTQISLMEGIKEEEIKNNLKIIFEECQRTKGIIQRLLKFCHPSKGEMKKMDINRSIEAVMGILEQQFKLVNIEIKRNYLENPPLISIDEQQMQEVFMNLINNAKDAMPDGGVITITTSLEGGFLRIDFKDTGVGISEEAIKNIFVPFFTTKEQGTGLGLSVCYGIIKAHNGELKLESQLNEGTTVTVLLPLVDNAT